MKFILVSIFYLSTFANLHSAPADAQEIYKPFRDKLSSGGYGPAMIRLEGYNPIGNGSNQLAKGSYLAAGQFEVTTAEYVQFLNAIDEQFLSSYPFVFHDEWFEMKTDSKGSHIKIVGNHYEVEEGFADYPMFQVSWVGANAYVKWLREETGKDYRLPTEAEWEYAARGGTDTKFWWGEADPVCDKDARNGSQFEDCSVVESPAAIVPVVPVGSFTANPFNLYNIHGNVSELIQNCSSIYDFIQTYENPKPNCDSDQIEIRGGSWSDGVFSLVNRFKDSYPVTYHTSYSNIGFRVFYSHPIKKQIGKSQSVHTETDSDHNLAFYEEMAATISQQQDIPVEEIKAEAVMATYKGIELSDFHNVQVFEGILVVWPGQEVIGFFDTKHPGHSGGTIITQEGYTTLFRNIRRRTGIKPLNVEEVSKILADLKES